MHYAVSGHTTAEIIKERANSNKDFMGLTNFNGNYPIYDDAIIAKNYLDDKELDMLNRIVFLYLDFAELQALEENVMTMSDWVNQLDYFLKMSKKEVLDGKGIISHEEAMIHAKIEYRKFKQRLFTTPTKNEQKYLENFAELLTYEKRTSE